MEQLRMKLDAAERLEYRSPAKIYGDCRAGRRGILTLGQFHTGVEEIARQVGALLEQLIQSAE